MFRNAACLFVTLITFAALLPGADTSWSNVKDLKGHPDLRVYKKGAREPINAVFADASDESLIVVVKKEQMAIPKDDIDRIDARPLAGPRKATVQKTATETGPDYTPGRPQSGPPLPQTNESSNVSFGGKPDFETIYRRVEGAPKK